MDRWRQYLFESHSEATLRAWARRLRLFRFCRAYGGHMNDGDSLDVVYRYRRVAQLRAFFDHLGVELVMFSEKPKQPTAGVAYSPQEFASFPALVPGTKWVRQPGHCSIASRAAFVWCGPDNVKISLANDYVVTEREVEAAEVIERALAGAPLSVKDPPTDSKHCICPKYYPAFFE